MPAVFQVYCKARQDRSRNVYAVSIASNVMSEIDLKTRKVWRKGTEVPDIDPNDFRKDKCGAWIRFSRYGDRHSDFGWDIHHIHPKSRGGSDSLENLIPLHWKNNLATGDSAELYCKVKAFNDTNREVC